MRSHASSDPRLAATVRYRGPSIAGVVGLALALAGLGAQLAGWEVEWLGIVIFAAGVAVVVLGVAWAGMLRLERRLVARVVAAVERDIGAPPEQDQAGNRARELRKAINSVREEIEYLAARVIDRQGGYWYRGFRLPTEQWERYGPLIAGEDDQAHGALRAVYREADAINHDIDSQVTVDEDPLVPERRVKRLRTAVRDAEKALDAIAI